MPFSRNDAEILLSKFETERESLIEEIAGDSIDIIDSRLKEKDEKRQKMVDEMFERQQRLSVVQSCITAIKEHHGL